jgi:7-carboxy-7-deazaguanine synthase
MFLSIGNIFPPAPAKRGADGETRADISYEEFVQQVLKSYRTILEDVMQDPRLSSVRVLPQLHTLLWGNAKGR